MAFGPQRRFQAGTSSSRPQAENSGGSPPPVEDQVSGSRTSAAVPQARGTGSHLALDSAWNPATKPAAPKAHGSRSVERRQPQGAARKPG